MGVPQHLPLITAISYYVHNPVRALLPHWPKGLGRQRKIPQQHSLPPGICWGWRLHGIKSMAFIPYGWTPFRPESPLWRKWLRNWPPASPVDLIGLMPYALVQLNKDTCHAALPKEGHLGILPEGGTNSTTCRGIKPPGSLPAPRLRPAGHLPSRAEWTQGSHHNLSAWVPGPRHKPNWRWIHLLSRLTSYNPLWKSQTRKHCPPWQMLPLSWLASPLKTTPPKLEREVSMTMEVWSLLSQVMLDMSSHVSGNSTPKRPNPSGHTDTSIPHTERSLQATGHHHPRWACHRWHWDGRNLSRGSPHHYISPITKTAGSRSNTPPTDASHLWGEGQQGPRGAAGN